MASIARDFTDYLFNRAPDITGSVMDRAELCMKDYLAVTLAGAAANRTRWERLLSVLPPGNAQIVGYPEKTDSRTAALINGFNAHSLELDDGQRFAMIHPGAPVISAVRAAADDVGISGEKIRVGMIMGYEAACRCAIAMQPSHKIRGYHAAGTCGTIGAAIGTAFALGMDREETGRAVACAAGSAAGLLEMQEQGSELKPYNTGRAAMDGLAAAYMGMTGYETPEDILGGERGFFSLFSDGADPDRLTGKTAYFEMERVYMKAYASCRHSHAAVDAAVALYPEIRGREIAAVEVRTYRLGVKGHDHREIRGIASARLSTPYAVAAGLLYGRADLGIFDPPDPAVTALARRITVREDPALTARFPEVRGAAVTVFAGDGTSWVRQVDHARGEPENPLTAAELEEKWKWLGHWARTRADRGREEEKE